jgi:cytochrome c oxidase subunit 1
LKRFALPAAWLAGAAIVTLVTLGGPLPQVLSVADTYYVMARAHYGLSLVITFVAFAAIYGFLEALPAFRLRRPLAIGHFVLTILGALMIFTPSLLLRLSGPPKRFVDFQASFTLWSRVSTIGYGLTLLGLALFVILLIDGVAGWWKRRAPASRPS